ncbi:hypothetical protein C0Q70_15810 [Pomacea canaliculata]|uniref:Galectin n=1 Tax=Pomacea canaliculata TaxID=400727 RepID=A0A2T7NVW4_POMCA|nr:hypothetical protein C0Q70_15810 [Pomacea canaliculata]
MTFNQGEVKDEGRGLWLDLTHPSSVEAVKDESAIGGWAGAFRGTGFSFLHQNTLGATFRIKFRFQLCNGHPDSDLLLVNNGCLESDAMPTLQVSYRAWNRILAFQMETQNSIRPYREECQIASQDRWIDINIHYYNNTLEIFANGVQCVKSSAFAGGCPSCL